MVSALTEKLAQQVSQLSLDSNSSTFEGMTISTLNAFGYRLLRDYFPDERLDVVSAGRSHRFARDLLGALRQKSPEHHAVLPGNLGTRVYLDFLGFLKNQIFDPRQVDPQAIADFILSAPQAEPFFEGQEEQSVRRVVQALVWLYQTYEAKLQDHRLMDFDDQKLRPYALLMENESVATGVQGKYDEVVVDEFQDINKLDFELIRLISAKADLVVTGDDDQAIYGFRGCSPEYIINLEHHLERPVTSYELQVNYRCPPNIVDSADRLSDTTKTGFKRTQFHTEKIPRSSK